MNNKRIRDYGIVIGRLPAGPLNKITDVPGVSVGHFTRRDGNFRTGVTVVIPSPGNLFAEKLTGVCHVINGFGKTEGTVQLDELGQLETPIALTGTLNVGKVADGLVGYTLDQCRKDGVSCASVNPVVGETNDCSMSDGAERPIGEAEVRAAIDAACEDFDEGDVGAGTGTRCFGLKGGIGSASRRCVFNGREYTIGVLVQSNFGVTADLMINGQPVGRRICDKIEEESRAAEDKGSVMIVLGTDIPLTELQLKRVCRRAAVGLCRTGSYLGHGSGDVVLGFTTANRYGKEDGFFRTATAIADRYLDVIFRGAAEAVEEAVLNSMTTADTVTGYTGKTVRSINDFLPDCLDQG